MPGMETTTSTGIYFSCKFIFSRKLWVFFWADTVVFSQTENQMKLQHKLTKLKKTSSSSSLINFDEVRAPPSLNSPPVLILRPCRPACHPPFSISSSHFWLTLCVSLAKFFFLHSVTKYQHLVVFLGQLHVLQNDETCPDNKLSLSYFCLGFFVQQMCFDLEYTHALRLSILTVLWQSSFHPSNAISSW